MTPVTRFRVFGAALLAKTAAILAQIKVNTMHRTQTDNVRQSADGKSEKAPVSAVKVNNKYAGANSGF